MATNLATRIGDSIIEEQIALLQAIEGSSSELLSFLSQMDSRITSLILRGPTTYTRARLQQLQAQVRSIVNAFSKKLREKNAQDLSALAGVSAKAAAHAANDVFETQIIDPVLNPRVLRQVVEGNVYGAATLKGFWDRQTVAMRTAYEGVIREGIVLGEGKGKLVNRLLRHPAINAPKHHVRTWVRTSMMGVANESRQQMYQANADIIKGIVWLSTLDTRTSNICKALDGLQWDLEYNPIRHDRSYPGPIAHPNCRSAQIPVLRSFEELAGRNKNLARDLDRKLSQGTRESMDGQVPATTNYEDFLKKKGDDFARATLGPTRFRLWKEGKIGIRDLVDQSSRPKLVRELLDESVRAPTGWNRPKGVEDLTHLASESLDLYNRSLSFLENADADTLAFLEQWRDDRGYESIHDLLSVFSAAELNDPERRAFMQEVFRIFDEFSSSTTFSAARVFRGLRIESADLPFRVGDTLVESGFFPSSIKFDVASGFADTLSGHRIVFDIRIPSKSHRLLSVPHVDQPTEEFEMLFPPGSIFRIVGERFDAVNNLRIFELVVEDTPSSWVRAQGNLRRSIGDGGG